MYKYETIAKENQINVIEALKEDQKKYPITIQGYIHWLEKYSQMRDFKRNTIIKIILSMILIMIQKRWLKVLLIIFQVCQMLTY